MTEKEVLRYLSLVDRKLTIYVNSGTNWKPEYEEELANIDKELAQLRALIDDEHKQTEETSLKNASRQQEEFIEKLQEQSAAFRQQLEETLKESDAQFEAMMKKYLERNHRLKFIQDEEKRGSGR